MNSSVTICYEMGVDELHWDGKELNVTEREVFQWNANECNESDWDSLERNESQHGNVI